MFGMIHWGIETFFFIILHKRTFIASNITGLLMGYYFTLPYMHYTISYIQSNVVLIQST